MNIFLTGATGLVGGELLVHLSKRPEVASIYCLVRAKDEQEGAQRLQKVFDLHGDTFDNQRIKPIVANLFDEDLAAQLAANEALQNIETVIHSAANTSFSRFNDAQVEKANIGGLTKMLLWAKELKTLKTFLYIGTATICGKDIESRVIHETESPNIEARHVVKYTYTKMKGELLIREHLREDQILIARPSIIMGDSRAIVPRSPVILWAMATMNHLRLLPVNQHSQLDIIPVDFAAKAIVGLLFANRHYHVYHISCGEAGATSAFKLAKSLAEYFTTKPPFVFIQKSMMNQVKHWTRSSLHPESELYSYREYLDYWKHTFEDKSRLRILVSGLDPYLEFMELGHVFDNSRLLEDVDIAQPEAADQYIKKSMGYVAKIDVLEGEIDP